MNETNRQEFIQALRATMDLYSRKLSADAYSLWFSALAAYALPAIKQALNEYIRVGEKFAPVPSQIISILQSGDGWPDAEEAWAMMAPALCDERVTMVATDEMMAAFSLALNLRDDAIAARMAFKAKYSALLAQARKERRAPQWSPSLGWDVAGQEGPLREAARLGRLPQAQVDGLLPERRQVSTLRVVQALAREICDAHSNRDADVAAT